MSSGFSKYSSAWALSFRCCSNVACVSSDEIRINGISRSDGLRFNLLQIA